MKGSRNLKLKKIAFNSLIFGIIGAISFIFIEKRSLSFIEIVGGFLLTFIPVVVILTVHYFISTRYLIRLHGILFLAINSLIYFAITVILILTIIIAFNISPDYAAGKISFFQILYHPDTQLAIGFIGLCIILIQSVIMINSFLGNGMLARLFIGTYHNPRKS